MRVSAVKPDTMECILRLLTPENAAACRLALWYGLRISDVLALHPQDVHKASTVVTERKTGKKRKIVWSNDMRELALRYSNKTYCFPSRLDPLKPRTRQAVYKDLKRAQKALRLDGNIGTHSMRKSFAVRKFKATGDVRRVQSLLNHSSEAVTMLYALANEVDSRGKANLEGGGECGSEKV